MERASPLFLSLPGRKSSTGCPRHPLWRKRHGGDQQRPARQCHEGGPAPASTPAPWHEDHVFNTCSHNTVVTSALPSLLLLFHCFYFFYFFHFVKPSINPLDKNIPRIRSLIVKIHEECCLFVKDRAGIEENGL